MKLGMNLPVMVPGLDRHTILEWARRIDAGPYTSLAAGERITFPNPEIMVTMAAAAAVTERVRLALTVIVLPMHSAVLMAKQVATLDVISGGRVTLGVGIGARVEDYRAAGAPFDGNRLKRMEEQIALMRRVWAGENVVEGALRPVEPRPVQPGGPELLAGALAPQSICRSARWANGLCGFSFGPSAEEVGFAYETARRAWQEAGRQTPPRFVMSFWFALGEKARAQLDEYLQRYLCFLGDDVAKAMAPTVKTTSAAALRDAARMLADLGTDELLLVPTTSDPDEVNRVADILG
jgi:alkanesulfonate monooxygenase SsuD/methylene tetrahydromethanopterin reductase-like flavin-dependent oxidoreductase (luciferase family)